MQTATQPTWTSLFVPAMLIYTIGLLMVYDASSAEIVDLMGSKNEFGPFFRQLFSGSIAFLFAYTLYRIGWKRLLQHSLLIYITIALLLLLVLIPGVGSRVNGSRRWLILFGFSCQPSEFLKLFLPAFYLYYLEKRHRDVYGSFRGFFLMMVLLILPIVFIAAEPNNGSVGVLGLLLGLLLLTTKVPLKYWCLPSVVLSTALFFFALNSPYVRARFQAYINPETDLRGRGHQPYQAKIAAGSGGLFGRGPAKSVQKLSYLPEAQNDYIAAIYAEEFGFIGMCVLIALYAWLLFGMSRHVARMKETAPFMWGLCVMFLLLLQTFMNLGVVSGLLPTTGLNLPFFSQGGSSLMVNAGSLGVLASMIKSQAGRTIGAAAQVQES